MAEWASASERVEEEGVEVEVEEDEGVASRCGRTSSAV